VFTRERARTARKSKMDLSNGVLFRERVPDIKKYPKKEKTKRRLIKSTGVKNIPIK